MGDLASGALSRYFTTVKKLTNNHNLCNNFGILLGLMRKVSSERWPFGYRSPTDMGVNMMRVGIVDDAVCRRAGIREIRRRLRMALKVDRGSVESERLGRILASTA